jgi:hypothetical protein
MSQSVTICCTSALTLASFLQIMEEMKEGCHAALIASDREVQLMSSDYHSYVAASELKDIEDALEDYATNPDLDLRFRSEVRSLQMFAIYFSDLAMVRRLVELVAQALIERGQDAWMDTDYGWVIRLSDVLIEVRRDPTWDWRRQAP